MPFLDCSCPRPVNVLAKAALTTAEMLGLKQADLAAILGVHKSNFGRLGHAPNIDLASEIGERALLLVRYVRCLRCLEATKCGLVTLCRCRTRSLAAFPHSKLLQPPD